MSTQRETWPGWKPWIVSKGCDVVRDPISRKSMPGERYIECYSCRAVTHARDLPFGTSIDDPPDACPACGTEG